MGKLTLGQQMIVRPIPRPGMALRRGATLRAYWIHRSKYLPHQGKRERERRAGAA